VNHAESGRATDFFNSLLGVPSSTSPISDICAFLSSRHQLLVLDCCERALLGVASLVEALNKSAPGVSILATSREALHAVGERTTQLPPLEMPSPQNGLELDVALEHAAIRLFVLRATAAGSDFRATDADVAAIVDLCRRLDGLPLAIELAAVHTLAFSVHELTTLLDSRFQLAGIGRRTGEPRHQTLQATLDWSYDLLAEQDRKVLCRLSVFEGSATLEAILAVVSDGDLSRTSVAESLARLSEKSLLKREVIDGSVHRRLLDTTRAYAAGRLQASGDEGSCRRRLAQFLAAEVTRSQIEGEHLSAVAWFGPACPNLGNLRAAFRWAANSPDDQLLAVALACAALPILMQLSRLEECQRWSEQALLLIDQGGLPDPRRIMLLAFRGTAMLGTQGPVDASLAAIELALESAEREGDAGFQALTLSGLYWLRMYRGESNAAIECAQGLGDLAPADDAAQRVRDHYVAMATCIAGRQSAASLLFDAIDSAPALVDLGRFMRIGSNPSVLTKAFQVKTLWLTGRSTAAMELYNHCEPILREPEHGLYLCLALNEVMIPFFCFHADWYRAESAVAELLEHSDRQMMAIRRRSGEAAAEAVALLQGKGDLDKYFSALQDLRPWYDDVLGRALVARGEPAKAAAILDDAATLCARSGNGWWLPAVFTSRAYAASAMGAPFENFDFAAATLAREQGASAFTGGSKPAT
jgi:predicted ATPase